MASYYKHSGKITPQGVLIGLLAGVVVSVPAANVPDLHRRHVDAGVPAAIIENQIHRAAERIDGHPLKELIPAVMDGISVHAHWRTPRFAAIDRG